MHELEKMKIRYKLLKTKVSEMNRQRGLSPSEYSRLRKLKQLKLWYKDKICRLSEDDGM